MSASPAADPVPPPTSGEDLAARGSFAPEWRTREGRVVLAVLCVLACYHISLLGRGAMAWGDELVSMKSLDAARALAAADPGAFGAALGTWGARPGEVVLRIPAAALQLAIRQHWGLAEWSPASLQVPAAQNVIVAFLTATLFYRLSLLLLGGRAAAATATTVFALLACSHLWVRHVVPYDAAMLLSLAALLLVLRIRPAPGPVSVRALLVPAALVAVPLAAYPLVFRLHRPSGLPMAVVLWAATLAALGLLARTVDRAHAQSCIAAGLVAGLALSVYPAWYSFHAGLLLFVAIGGASGTGLAALSCSGLRNAALAGLSLFAVMCTFEMVVRCGDVSYFGGAALLSRTIVQGSFEEGLVFLPKYLWRVEGLSGLLLCLGAGGTALGWLASRAAGPLAHPALTRLALIFGGLYLLYGGVQGTLLHRMTFSGRYIRIYLPFVVWVAVAGVAALRSGWLRRGLLGLLCVGATFSFLGFARTYAQVDYPIDVLYRLGIGFEDVVPENLVYETEVIPEYALPVKALTEGASYVTRPGDRRFALVNFGYIDPAGRPRQPFLPPPGAALLASRTHFLTFVPMTFEGSTVSRRAELIARAYQLKVYRLP